jgi:hypothetical protein
MAATRLVLIIGRAAALLRARRRTPNRLPSCGSRWPFAGRTKENNDA